MLALNRAFSAEGVGYAIYPWGVCPRFTTANPSWGGLDLNTAPLALNTYEPAALMKSLYHGSQLFSAGYTVPLRQQFTIPSEDEDTKSRRSCRLVRKG